MTIGFVIKNSEGLYYSNVKDTKYFRKFDKNFVIIYRHEVHALDDINEFILNDLFTIERVVSTI